MSMGLMGAIQWDELAEAALARLRQAGVEYGDVRILDTTTQTIRGEDRRIAGIREAENRGLGVRALYKGAWGFAASSILSAEEVPKVADLAVDIAKGSVSLAIEKVRPAPEPVHRDTVRTACRVDPFSVPLEEKTRLLLDLMEAVDERNLPKAIPAESVADEGVTVIIGTENPNDSMRECSIVITSYGTPEGHKGAIAVLGPTRMHYPRAIATVRYMGRVMTDVLTKIYS